MDLSLFEELTGIDVPDNQQAVVEAQIRRTQKILEAMLGFTLDPDRVQENLYNETGIATSPCSCPNVISDLEDSDLEPAEDVFGAYRLFSYNSKDRYFPVDPFTQIYNVKLVWDDITIKIFNPDEFRANFHNGWGKYIENCQRTVCSCTCTNCVQLAVDADWLFMCDSSVDSSVGCVSDDLLYIWADMISHYADCKKDVKSESIGSHSYTRFDRRIPEFDPMNMLILKKYAGPSGTLSRVITP